MDITKYINREKLILDTIKANIRSYGDNDSYSILNALYPNELDEVVKDGKRYFEEPEEGADTHALAENIIDIIKQVEQQINNLFSFLNELELDYFDPDFTATQMVWMNDYWYKEFKEGEWGELKKKTQADPDYKNWHMEKLVERELKKGMKTNG
jgi:hypothetical protein